MKPVTTLPPPPPRSFRSLFVLFGMSLLRRRQAWFGILLSPMINTVVFFFVFGNASNSVLGGGFLASYLLLGALGPSLTSLGIHLAGWKRTVMFKRIGGSVRVWQIIVTAVLIYTLAGILTSILLLGLMFLLIGLKPFGGYTLPRMLTQSQHWWWVLLAVLLTLAIGCSFSLLAVGGLKNTHRAEALVIITAFLTLLLGGIIFPLKLVDQNPFLFVISFLLPFKFCVYMANAGFGAQPLAGTHWYGQASATLVQHPWISLVGASVILGVLLGLAVRYFKWESSL